jgi:PST family polysaccharide transporter
VSRYGSYRQALRATSIIGGASIANIAISLLRTKIVAILLGPAGVGLIGLYQTLMSTASTVAGLGFSTAGTRQVAEASGANDEAAVAAVRRSLFWATLTLATLGSALVWCLRDEIAAELLGDAKLNNAVGWLALGVGLGVASGSQGALLSGLRRVGDVARLSVWSSILATILGLTALWLIGERGVVAFVLSWPLANFLLGHWYVSKLPKLTAPTTPFPVMLAQWSMLTRLGAAFMVGGLAVVLGQLAVQVLIQRELGLVKLGQFQAAWMISMTYVGVVLQAMGTDYYPRLSAVIGDRAAANQLVNEQAELGVLLAGPLFVGMIGFSPWVIELLYTREFAGAEEVLRWQVVGDILKVASAPLIYVVLAVGAGRAFMLTQIATTAVFILLTWLGIPFFGAEASGIAFVGMCAAHMTILYYLARRATGFVWHSRLFLHFVVLIAVSAVVFYTSVNSRNIGGALGALLGVLLGLYALVRLAEIANLGGLASKVAAFANQLRALVLRNGR